MSRIHQLIAATSILVSAAAASAPLVQDVRVHADHFHDHVFVAGSKAAGGVSGSASDAQLYWYDSASNTAVGALGGGASVTVDRVTHLRGIDEQRTAYPVLARTTLKQGQMNDAAGWSIDLGADLLVSNVANHQVTSSSIRVIDFGNADRSPLAWFDFSVGLWNGTDIVLADGLDQLNLVMGASTVADGTASISYLGNNVFRFSETGMGSGASLLITSNVEGFHVRTLDTVGMGFEGDYRFSDWVDLAAGRELQAQAVAEVPEPSALALATLGFGLVAVARRRRVRA